MKFGTNEESNIYDSKFENQNNRLWEEGFLGVLIFPKIGFLQFLPQHFKTLNFGYSHFIELKENNLVF